MTQTKTPSNQTYQLEEVQQILNIAIASQSNQENLTRQQLLEIAEELSISPESLALAEQQWKQEQSDIQKRRDFNTYRLKRFQKSLGSYAIANLFLVGINFLNSNTLSWSLYILLGWGLFIGLKAWDMFRPDIEEYEKAFQRWNRNRQFRQSIAKFFDNIFKS